MIRRIWRSLLYCLYLFVVCSVLLEITARLFLVGPGEPTLLGPGALRDDPEIRYRLIPKGRFQLSNGIYPYEVAANNDGFRDEDWAWDTPEFTSAVRIMHLGDSFAMGQAAHAHETYVELLQARLNATIGQPVNSMNFAILGYSLAEELAVLQTYGDRVRPAAVVWSIFPWNDTLGNTASGLFELQGEKLVAATGGIAALDRTAMPAVIPLGSAGPWRFSQFLTWVKSRSINTSLYFQLARLYRRSFGASGPNEARQTLSAHRANVEMENLLSAREPGYDLSAEPTMIRAILRTGAEWCEQRGIPLLVLLIPASFQVGSSEHCRYFWVRNGQQEEQADCDLLHRKMTTWVTAQGIRFLDLLPVLRPLGFDGFVPAEGHLSPAGHRAITDAVLAPLTAALGKSMTQ